MKEENVKIIQISVKPYAYYTSSGGMYKNKTETNHIYGLGDDSKIYEWGEWSDPKNNYKLLPVNWKLYIPS